MPGPRTDRHGRGRSACERIISHMTRALHSTLDDQRPRAGQSSCGALSRRGLLTGTAAMTSAALWDSRPALARGARSAQPDSTTAAQAKDLPDYAPVPRSALVPALNEQGYYVGRVERNLYWITDGAYQSAFLTTPDGVVLLDAPPTIGHNIQRAVDEIAAENGVSNKVTHLIYSHHHADHAGASSLFDKNVTRIGHEETRRLLLRDNDSAGPPNEETFGDRRTLEIGGERIDLAWHGTNHSPDNIFIHLPDHDTLMLIDIVNPGWAPFCRREPDRGHPRLHRGAGQRARLLVEALHRRPHRPTRHARRRDPAPAVHGRHRRQLQAAIDTRRSDALLPEVRREHLGRGQGIPRRGDRRPLRRRSIEKYTGVFAAADVFTASTAFWVMQSIRLDLGYGSQVHP